MTSCVNQQYYHLRNQKVTLLPPLKALNLDQCSCSFRSVLSTLSAILTADGRKWQRGLERYPFPLLDRLTFVHWVPCRIWCKHNTTLIHKMKQIIIRERKTEYKNSGSNPILDDNIHNPGRVLPYKRLMGLCRWMGSHFHDWINYKGVAFSIELLEWSRTFSDF